MMKIFKIKTLTMRIWMSFTVMILIIICSTSILYFSAFRIFDQNAKMQDLKTAQDMLIKNNNFNEPLRFDKMRNLERSQSFIAVKQNGRWDIEDLSSKPQDGPMPHDTGMKNWMVEYISKTGDSEKQFKEKYNNLKTLFIISPLTGYGQKAYLITYMPYFVDNRMVYSIMAIGAFFIIIGFFAAKVAAKNISKPLKQLEDYTKIIASKDWNEPIKINGDEEIASLANSMNVMQKKLKYADENEKMFLQSISHDLKTPVMVIMSHAQAIIDGIYIDSIEKTAQIIKDEAIRLEKKIKQMLYLNTLDYVLENNIENEKISTNGLLDDMVCRFKAFSCNIEWKPSKRDIFIFGDEDKIRISIENIFDNALRYVKDKIKLSVKEENDFAVIEIYNDGDQIPSKSVDKIFDNLYKDKKGKFGLGLAISKKIIKFYGGDIKAINREVGVSFIIKYPICNKENL